MKPQTELAALAAWILISLGLFTPGLMLLGGTLLPTPSVDAQLITNTVISLCIFLLPTFFLPSGKAAWSRISQPLPANYRKPKHSFTILGLSLLVLLLAQLLYMGIIVLAQKLGYPVQDAVEARLLQLLSSGEGSPPLLFLTMAVVPAITEEFFFRGLLQGTLQRVLRHKRWLPIILSAGIFALFHGAIVGFPSRMLLGLVLGYLTVDSRNLRLPILLHFLNNTLALLSIL